MKYFTSTLAVTAATFVLQGCKKEENNNNEERNSPNTPEGTLNSLLNEEPGSTEEIQNKNNHLKDENKQMNPFNDADTKEKEQKLRNEAADQFKQDLPPQVLDDLKIVVGKPEIQDSEGNPNKEYSQTQLGNLEKRQAAEKSVAEKILAKFGITEKSVNDLSQTLKREIKDRGLNLLENSEDVQVVVEVLDNDVLPFMKDFATQVGVEQEFENLTEYVMKLFRAVPGYHSQIVAAVNALQNEKGENGAKLRALEKQMFREDKGFIKFQEIAENKYLVLEKAFNSKFPEKLKKVLQAQDVSMAAAMTFLGGLVNHPVVKEFEGYVAELIGVIQYSISFL